MTILYKILAIVVFPLWIWLIIKLKVRHFEDRERKDEVTKLNLRD